MPQLSEQANALIEEFERKIDAVPAPERDAVLRRMASHISALNEDLQEVIVTLQKHEFPKSLVEDEHSADHRQDDLSHLSDFI